MDGSGAEGAPNLWSGQPLKVQEGGPCAHDWTPERREAYANDLGADRSLVAVTAKNRSKADRDPAQWMPPSESATCTYLVDWTATKLRWNLTMDGAEKTALLELAEPCADSVVEYETAS